MRDYLISFPMLGENLSLNPSTSFSPFGLTFHFYGLIIAVGFILALAYCMRRCNKFGITQDNLIDTLLFAVPLAIVGARIYYVVFQWQDYADDLMKIFRIWEGGLALYGSVIGAVAGAVIACRWRKISIGAMLDVGAPGLLIGQIVGRWANFINREAFGAETDILWKMGLTNPRTNLTIYVHPTFLYESLWNLFGFILLNIFVKKGKRQFDGQLFAMYAAWYGLGRMLIEGLRSDSLYISGTGVRASQLLAALSFVAAMVFLIVMLRRPYRPERLWVNRLPSAAGEIPVGEAEIPETGMNTQGDGKLETGEEAAGEKDTDLPPDETGDQDANALD